MDFTIAKEELLAALEKCIVAVPGDHHSAAFNVVRVEARRKNIRFVGVGEAAAVDAISPATEIKEAGTFNVRPQRLRDIASSMPRGGIRVSLKGTRVTVKSAISSRKATFEHHVVDPYKVEDPGKEAPWIDVDAKELARALRIAKSASHWEDRNDPDVTLLLPTERGVDVFGCNMYLITLVESSLRFDGDVVMIPRPISESLAQMIDNDDKVQLFSDARRVYLQNCDTLVSAALPASNPFVGGHGHMISILKSTDRVVGPVFDPQLMLAGVKAVLVAAGFANQEERKKGSAVRLRLGDTALVEMAVGVADARDEFGCIQPGADIDVLIGSDYLLKMLGSLEGYGEARACFYEGIFILQTQGIICGAMTRKDPGAT